MNNTLGKPGRFPAPAKINLYLRVREALPNGYHLLDTAFAYVDAMDLLDISQADDLVVTCTRRHLSGQNNLVYRVLAALQKRYGVRSGMHVHIIKKIPEQAGLGGGSSDAATAIMVANRQWNLNLSTEAMIEFSLPFGADIPCFLFGRASKATGVGEQLSPLPESLPARHVLLAFPGTGLSTTEVFRHLDLQLELTRNRQPDNIRIHSCSDGNIEYPGLNHLEASAIELCPPIGNLLKAMHIVGGTAWMSGSGSACVGILSSHRAEVALARELQDRGLATWTHAGKLMTVHPLMMKP